MLFNSLAFAAFFPTVFLLYWVIPSRGWKVRNLLLLAASYFFYGLWDWRFLGLLLFSSSLDFALGLAIERAKDSFSRKAWLAVGLVTNLGLLGFFKYFNFFADSFADFLRIFGVQAHPFTLYVVLPVGISFYTFQSLSYTLDVYRGQIKASTKYFSFLTYVAFFPQLVAGPIERASHLLPQFQGARKFSYPQAVEGMRLVLWGLFKKMVVSDLLAGYADATFDDPANANGVAALFGILCFAFRIYGDFSGYTDIARGTAKLLGFELMLNFNRPYFASGLRDFWTRWHISLSTWFREYLYLPLGGNRKGTFRWIFNILLTFVVSGFWHGANWTFLVWGFLHGAGYLVEFAWTKSTNLRAPRWVAVPLTFATVCVAWVFFRAASVFDALVMLAQSLRAFLTVGEWGEQLAPFVPHPAKALAGGLAVVLMLAAEALMMRQGMAQRWQQVPQAVRWLSYLGLAALILLFGEFGEPQRFIYFQF
jgi:D-alanyl-lipoteichoic acid acyltransferase DltB (MBOAT superfamily)